MSIDDREPEPDEPIDLDGVEDAYAKATADVEVRGLILGSVAEILAAVPGLVAELRAARADRVPWTDRDEQYAMSYDDQDAPTLRWHCDDAHEALMKAGANRGTAWVRDAFLGPWRELTPDIDNEPPF